MYPSNRENQGGERVEEKDIWCARETSNCKTHLNFKENHYPKDLIYLDLTTRHHICDSFLRKILYANTAHLHLKKIQ